MPDGRIARFNVPEGMSRQEAQAQFEAMIAGGAQPTTPPAQQPMDERMRQFAADPGQAMRGAAIGPAGIGEAALTLGSGMIAEPLAGLAGLAASPFVGADRASEIIGGAREAMTYQPRTEAGQRAITGVAESAPIQAIGKGLQAAEQTLGDIGFEAAGPVGGAIGASLPTAALEALGLKGIGKVRGARKVTGITDEIAEKLDAAGVNVDDLTPQQVTQIQGEVATQTQEQARRAKLFDELGIPTVQSRITRSQADFLSERQLARDATGAEGALLQERRAAEAAGFQDASRRLIDELGAPDEAGDLIKEALNARVSGVAEKASQAYKKLGELTQGKSIPIIGNKILGRLDDQKTAALSGRLSKAERSQINDLMVEFGLDTDPARIDAWTKRRKASSGALPVKQDITPLTLENIEEFRQGLSGMTGFDASAELKGVAGALKRGVDEELADLDNALRASSGPLANESREILSAAKRARALFKGRKDLENVDGIVGRLTRGKPRTPDEQLILGSEVVKKLFSGTREGSIENIRKVVKNLQKAGPQGEKALGALQASAVADLLNAGMARTKLPGDVPQWLGNQFAKRFDQLNANGKLDEIFKGNPKAMDAIKKLREAGELTVPFADVAKSSGTADDLLNTVARNPVLKRMLQLGGGFGGVVAAEGVEKAAKGASTRGARKAVKRALSVKPDDAVQVQQVRRLFPNLAAVLLPPQFRQERED